MNQNYTGPSQTSNPFCDPQQVIHCLRHVHSNDPQQLVVLWQRHRNLQEPINEEWKNRTNPVRSEGGWRQGLPRGNGRVELEPGFSYGSEKILTMLKKRSPEPTYASMDKIL